MAYPNDSEVHYFVYFDAMVKLTNEETVMVGYSGGNAWYIITIKLCYELLIFLFNQNIIHKKIYISNYWDVLKNIKASYFC